MASPSFKSILIWIGIPFVFVALAIIYRVFNPDLTAIFPQCPFRLLTGLECPGCGSQRAVHYLLNFRLVPAFGENALLVISIPYILGGFVIDQIKKPAPLTVKIRNTFYGKFAIWTILITIIVFWIARNFL